VTRRRLAAAVALGAVLYAGAFALVFTDDIGERRTLVVLVVAAGLLFSVTGAVAAARRPDNPTGGQMLAVGLLWSLGSLQAADGSLAFTLGYVLSGIAFVPFTWLILSYPTGRLPREDRWIVGAVAAIVVLGPLAVALVDPTPVPSCDGCPTNALLVADDPGVARAVRMIYALGAAAVAATLFVRLVRRYLAATPPLRRVIGPVYVFTLEALAALVVSSVVRTFSESASLWLEQLALASLALMPIAFLIGVLRTRLARAGIADLAIALGRGTPLRDALADALGDPSLDLAYWSTERQAWVDAEGHTLGEPLAQRGHAATFVEHGGRRVAALLHDASLADQGNLVDAVAATSALAFEKERLQAELRAQYRFLETVINTAPSLLSVVDTEGRMRNFNRAVEIASGRDDDRSGLEGTYFWDVFIDPGEREEMVERFRRAAPDFPAAEYENTFTDARGKERVIAWRSAPLVDENGTVVRIIAGGIDITERKRREVELQRQRDFANTVADAIPSFIVVTDHDATMVPWGANRAFCEAMGCTAEELGGRSFLESVARDDEFATRMAIAGAANGVPQPERETRWVTRDGHELTVAWTATPILDQWGLARVLICGIDVSERKRQEEELRASRARIVDATDAARRRLERNLHDGAQQRLAALALSLRLAESRIETDITEATGILVRAREELARALEELRELARGLHPNVLTDRGLGAALEALVLRSPFPVDVDVLPERLPPAIEAAAYYVAAEALANVAKYAHATSAQVEVFESEDGAELVVQVSDDGVGGADPTRGTGLRGLEDRVASLDGRLAIASPRGGGTRLRASIPLARRAVPLSPGTPP
jgi:PAS domain S-box-containing protein